MQRRSLRSSDIAYSVLADKRRRYAVHYLKQRGEPVPLNELAEQVAAWENNKPVAELTSKERKRVYIAMYQSHLETLSREGIVEYDADRGVASISDDFNQLEIYLEAVPSGSVPWSLYYVGLTVVNGLMLALAWFDFPPFASLPDLIWGTVVLVTFGVSAFVQTYQSRRMRFGDEGPPPELRSEVPR
ncbi:DUF7344 domain-containing protein [Halobellus captivus]|uniref:DUF7344 domain-containing protein n=1 Tax=Halobellus captivus TaxID=2592614 RepID=UPI0011A33624|nr:hypothetical protein [Halobellus captivus]